MAKRRQQESQPSNGEQPQEDFSRSHPLMRHTSQAQQFAEEALKRDKAHEFKINEVAEWKRCVNSVASTIEGKLFLKSMIDFSGIMAPPVISNANAMVTNTIKGAFYFTWVRPFLEPKVRKELE